MNHIKKLIFTLVVATCIILPTNALANTTYTVKSGDYLWKIAVATKTGISELIKSNPSIKNPDRIYVGQVLTIPTNDVAANYENEVIRLTNLERTKAGLKPFVTNWELSRVARYKSEDMSKTGTMSHNSKTYGTPFQMMKSFGITYKSAGENIAQGQRSPQEVVKAWMNSSGHRANILDKNFNQIGVGYSAKGNYWTQQFIQK